MHKRKRWTEELPEGVYMRLCACASRKSDLIPLTQAKWNMLKEHGLDASGFGKEEALISVLELLDENGIDFELTKSQYDEILNRVN